MWNDLKLKGQQRMQLKLEQMFLEVAQMHCGSVRKKARHPTQYQTRKRVIKDVRINDEELNIELRGKGEEEEK